MLLQIILFEIKYRLKRPATYIYFFLFFAFSFLLITLPGSSVSEAGEQLQKNSPYAIGQLASTLILFGSIILAGIMGVPVYREFDHRFNEIVFSLPVKKTDYLLGKFIGSYAIAVFVHIGILLGLLLGTMMPWMDKTELGPFMIESYLTPLFVFLLPNVFILGIFFFTVGTLWRSQIAIYAQGLILIVLYIILSKLMEKVDTNPVNSLFEPFGLAASSFETKYWTTFEKNTLQIPLSGYLLFNRIFWTAISMLIGLVCYLAFSPVTRRNTGKREPQTKINKKPADHKIQMPEMVGDFSFKAQFMQWWYFSVFHFKRIIRAVPFWIMLACGIGLLLLGRMGINMLETTSLPVTYMLLDFLQGIFIIFAILIISIYTGELIWKDIDVKIAPVIDSSPATDKLLVLSKFSAIVLVELFIIAFIILTGVAVQISEGFYHFQPDVYLKVLLLQIFPYLVIYTFVIFLIHTLIQNKYLGHTIVIAFFLVQIFSSQLGLEHVLVRYGETIQKSYSDLNQLNNFVFPTIITQLYWTSLGFVFLLLSILFVKRGSSANFRDRLVNFGISFRHSRSRWLLPAFMVCFVLIGSFIYYNTNIINTFRTKKADREHKASYELKYSKYKDAPMPRIVDVNLEVDLYPSKITATTRGSYRMVNKNKSSIDSIHLRTSPWVTVRAMHFSENAALVDSSKTYGYYIYKLDKPLLPGDTINLQFEISFQERGFHHWGHSTELVENGTFLHNLLLPSFGYDESEEIQDKKERKKAGLPEKKYESAEITDSSKYSNTYIDRTADRISYECIISTEPDQTAITCGTLEKTWNLNGRNYFHYKMNEPIWNFVPFLSARYAKHQEDYKGILLEIYYHPSHTYNLEAMVKAMKKTIDYCNAAFATYQHSSIRIVEFPRYSSFAQSFATTIPFSEALGFILKIDKKNDIDVPFYVTAHEVAHQWWAHQVCGADVKGKTLMVESLAEYTALMVLLEEYGNDQAGKFLKYELDRYMLLRATERKKEPPLYLVDAQQYLSYQKGCLAFYALQDFIGADSLNAALSAFIQKYNYQDAPYPTSLDLISFVEKKIPDSLNYLINDWFMNITLYSNRTDSAFYTMKSENEYQVDIFTTSVKYQADSLGRQENLPLADWVDVGVFTKTTQNKDSLIYIQKVKISDKNQKYSMIVNQKPSKAGIDPLFKLVDRNLLDNTRNVKAGS